MADHLTLLSSWSVGSWHQNVAFYAFLLFFILLNMDIISSKQKAGIKTEN